MTKKSLVLGELYLPAALARPHNSRTINESPDRAGALHPNENVNYFWNIKFTAAPLHKQQTPGGLQADGKYLEVC